MRPVDLPPSILLGISQPFLPQTGNPQQRLQLPSSGLLHSSEVHAEQTGTSLA